MFSGDVYAEIEVMKMVMELRVTESGWYVGLMSLVVRVSNFDEMFNTL